MNCLNDAFVGVIEQFFFWQRFSPTQPLKPNIFADSCAKGSET
jgi:hypothetical protein